jgi:ComF family protein
MAMGLLSSSVRCAREWTNCALNLIFPWPENTLPEPAPIEAPYCRQCGEPFPNLQANPSTDFICTNCMGHDWHFESNRSGYHADGQVLDAIIGFKYRDEYHHLQHLVEWLTHTYDRHTKSGEWDALVPVPLYHRRKRERGFNQAREIAQGLASNRKLTFLDCLYRYRETSSQTKLVRSARWENMAGAFRLKPKFDVRGKSLLIIDDVFTTGATADACAQALAQAGAARLAVLTIARS